MRYQYAPKETLSTVLSNSEEVRLTADANGILDVKDEEIDALLAPYVGTPGYPLTFVKGKG